MTIDVPFARINVAGVPFGVATCGTAVGWLLDAVREPDPALPVRLANAYCVTIAHDDQEYGRLLRRPGINFPDGAPVAGAMRLLAPHFSEQANRVRGPSFFRDALEAGVERGVRHYFLGATDATLRRLTDAVQASFPGVQIVGTYAPPFGPVDDALLDDLILRVRGSGAEVVWVGMGTPKQDFVAEAIAQRAGIYAVGVGAAFDFQAGTVREAPRWVQQSGFEWLFRLLMEPRRLWRRYTRHNLMFVALVGRQMLRPGRRRSRVPQPVDHFS